MPAKKLRPKKAINRTGLVLVILLLLSGTLLTWYTVKQMQRDMQAHLLKKASIAAQSINTGRLQGLEGSSEDIDNPDYLRIKEQLIDMRAAQPKCKFLYLMGRNSRGQVFFYVDAQKKNSGDYAPPGLIYTEVSEDYMQVFDNPAPKTVGPVQDRWGKLMTALVPITQPGSDKVVALLGMDVTANDWNKEILFSTLPVVVLVILAILLVYYVQQLRIANHQRKARERIRKKEEQYQALFEQAADGILTGKPSGEIIDANKSVTQLTGYHKNELIGSNISILFSQEQRQKYPLDYNAVMRGHTVLNIRKLTRKDGALRPIEMNTKKVGDGRLQTFIRDITERKINEQLLKEKNEELQATEEELKTSNEELTETNKKLARQKDELIAAKEKAEESDKLKSDFLANMSHEIRTPMNGIMGFSELLASEHLPHEEQVEYLQTIHSLTSNLMQIIDDIIDIAKIEANQLSITKETFSLNAVMDEMYKTYKLRIKQQNAKGIALYMKTAFNNEHSQIYTDVFRLKQVFNNLLGNAIKFTEKGSIEFGYTTKKDDEWLFWVKDTGMGIQPEEQAYIFDRFRQAGNAQHIMKKGTGLGLAISQNIVKLLGGTIWVESEHGEGSTFYFTLPRYPKPEQAPARNTQKKAQFKWEGKNILLVEDDMPSRKYLQKALQATGVKLIAVGTGENALEQFQQNATIDLILLDIRLPGMDGTEVIKKIRKQDATIPIIVQTAHSMDEDRTKYIRKGATDYIAKPIAMQVLLSTIQKYLHDNP